MKINHCQLLTLTIGIACSSNAYAFESRQRRRASNNVLMNNNKSAISVRGGVLKTTDVNKKRRSLFGIIRNNNNDKNNSNDIDGQSQSIRVPDMNSKNTNVKTQSTIVEASEDVDVQYRKALIKTVLTVASAALFGVAVMATRGATSGYEFFAGYLIEQSLSIDNLFVFIMLFEYFKVPNELQNRVLSWGISGAVILRGLMIGVGVAALQKFKSVILVFAFILLASSVNLLMEKEVVVQEGEQQPQHEENLVMKLTKALFPNTSSELHGENFFIVENGKRIATPLFLCLIAVELSDFVFAVDSIPAVLGVSKDPLIVYASNIFAIMALRSLYTVVAKAVSSFHYLKPAVALVLGFVGSKMIAEYFHIEISTGTSLAVICSLLGAGVVASIVESDRKRKENYVTIDSSTLTNSTLTSLA